MKKKITTRFTGLFLLLLTAIPARAVFNERDLPQTLRVLRFELEKAHSDMARRQLAFNTETGRQRAGLVQLMRDSDELSLMLYSQQQDFTFDLTYALEQITGQYRAFQESRKPYEQRLRYLDVEIERYERLSGELRSLPPVIGTVKDTVRLQRSLDPASLQNREQCLRYVARMLETLQELRRSLVADSEMYARTDSTLRQAYDYARARYDIVQKNIFTEGQDNLFQVLGNLPAFVGQAFRDAADKYGRVNFNGAVRSEWRGPIVIGFAFAVLFYLLIATLLGNLSVRVLMKRVPLFMQPAFRERKYALILLVSLLLFILAVGIGKAFVPDAHFYQMASALLLEYAALMAAILTSLLARYEANQLDNGLLLYLPVLVAGILIIAFRILFLPDSLITLCFPVLLILSGWWQLAAIRKNREEVPRVDLTFAWVSFAILAASLILSWCGFALLGIQVCIWWIFQLTVLLLIGAFRELIRRFRRRWLAKRLRAYRIKYPQLVKSFPHATVVVTWFPDFLEITLVPLLTVLSVPFCLFMAARVFDLTEIGLKLYSYPFLNYDKGIHLSAHKIVLAAGLYFVFRYLAFLLKSLYGSYKIRKMIRGSADGRVRENEINLTLANNVISILVWAVFILLTIKLWNVPTKALSVITAGLAAGLGFAMKDILNNFFYGVQLMSGRLRVGDYIECDGVRGKVIGINYQCTQIDAEGGSVMAITNSALFNKNFKNLTRSRSYEYLALPVGVAYGSDVEKVRSVILKAMAPLRRPDAFGRQVVEPGYGINVTFGGFGDSSVNLVVKQNVLVEERYGYAAKANELIYNALNKAGIEIPFPQREVRIKKD